MHWLKKFRRNYRREDGGTGISRKELAKMVKLRFGKCSERLIEIIEDEKGITCQSIADAIAVATGCTLEERNSIVHEDYRAAKLPRRKR